MSSSQETIGWKRSQDGHGQDKRSVPGYLDTICRKTNTDRGAIPLQLGIGLASQGLLSYRRGTGDFMGGAFLSLAEGRTLAYEGGQDASPTARAFHCGSAIDAGNGLCICAQRRGSESCAP